LSRFLFTAKSAPNAGPPAINWSEVEARLLAISAPAKSTDVSADLPVAPSAPLANDPPAPSDQPATNASDPFEDMLSLLKTIPSNRS